MIWLWAGGLLLIMVIVAIGAYAFGSPPMESAPRPSWMPGEADTGEHPYVGRRRRRPDKDTVGADGVGDKPWAEDKPWDLVRGDGVTSHPRTFELEPGDRGARTQRINWPPKPPPDWPIRPPVP